MATPYPTVRLGTPALDAAHLLVERRLPGLIVVDDADHPIAVLPGSQVLRFVIPGYIQDDPALARVLDEQHADRLCEALRGKTVQDLLPRQRQQVPVVAADDTVMEIAALMAATHSPLVAVIADGDETTPLIGAISVADLLAPLLPPAN